jgi:hypothetical protein
MIGVFMGAGAIAIITGIILVVQSIIEGERDKRQKVFDKKLALYSGIIEQMEQLYCIKEDEDVPMIDQHERMDLFFTQLKVALLARPKTFHSYSQLINDIANDEGVIKEEATKLLLDFVVDARNDLDVQEEMTAEDQRSLNESIKIAEKAASTIQQTGRGTYFVSEDPFQQYVDQFSASASGVKRPDDDALRNIRSIHDYLVEKYGSREGVTFDYTATGGCAGFALGQKRNAKFCYLRFDSWRGACNDQDLALVPTLYLLKHAESVPDVPCFENLLTAQSPQGYEFYIVRPSDHSQFSDQVRDLIELSFLARKDGKIIDERKSKPELRNLYKADLSKFCTGSS